MPIGFLTAPLPPPPKKKQKQKNKNKIKTIKKTDLEN